MAGCRTDLLSNVWSGSWGGNKSLAPNDITSMKPLHSSRIFWLHFYTLGGDVAAIFIYVKDNKKKSAE